MKITQRNNKFYTEKGLKAIETRIKTLIGLFNDNKFPFSAQMLGFGLIGINSQEECRHRIKELSELIGFKWDVQVETIKLSNGHIEQKKEIIY